MNSFLIKVSPNDGTVCERPSQWRFRSNITIGAGRSLTGYTAVLSTASNDTINITNNGSLVSTDYRRRLAAMRTGKILSVTFQNLAKNSVKVQFRLPSFPDALNKLSAFETQADYWAQTHVPGRNHGCLVQRATSARISISCST